MFGLTETGEPPRPYVLALGSTLEIALELVHPRLRQDAVDKSGGTSFDDVVGLYDLAKDRGDQANLVSLLRTLTSRAVKRLGEARIRLMVRHRVRRGLSR